MASTMSRAEIPRMRSGKPHSPDARDFAHRVQQFSKSPLPRRIFVGVYVLAQELDFGITQHRPSAALPPAPSQTVRLRSLPRV